MDVQNVAIAGIVATIIFSSIIFVALGGTQIEPEIKRTWYFIPGGCYSFIPEFTTICHRTEECGTGHLAKSIKGHGPVDQSEAWKLRDGSTKIDYTRCGEKIPSSPYP